MNPELSSEKQKIDRIFNLSSRLNNDPELLPNWAQYLCVLTSGFIENSLRIILTKYAADKATPQVANFVKSKIKGITNLNGERIAQLLNSFSSNWHERFINTMTITQKDSIDSVIANRHLIVHGRSVGLTLVRMKDYYKEVVEAITIIDEDCVNR
ncbi:MAG: HEPN domain-containing protein [Desulfobaccales bacterium]